MASFHDIYPGVNYRCSLIVMIAIFFFVVRPKNVPLAYVHARSDLINHSRWLGKKQNNYTDYNNKCYRRRENILIEIFKVIMGLKEKTGKETSKFIA